MGEGVVRFTFVFFLLCAIHGRAEDELHKYVFPVPPVQAPKTLTLIQESVRILRRKTKQEIEALGRKEENNENRIKV